MVFGGRYLKTAPGLKMKLGYNVVNSATKGLGVDGFAIEVEPIDYTFGRATREEETRDFDVGGE